MLRLYKSIEHEIFKLHEMLEHLVCSVWCQANNDNCRSKLHADFKDIYDSYNDLKNSIDEIYEVCKLLTNDEKKRIKKAFKTNNKIEELCNGSIHPVYLSGLPSVVETKMKPLLINFYENLLGKAKIPGTKLDYYQMLIKENDFTNCPCCGYMPFESMDSGYREEFDHYLPKALYPFLSVNFKNLVPLCHKCNSTIKGEKDPIANGKTAFFPFSITPHRISISFKINEKKDLRILSRNDLTVNIAGDTEKIETWDRLFDIKNRYNDKTRSFTKTFLSQIKRRYNNQKNKSTNPCSYTIFLNDLIKEYEFDKYEDMKFLKIPLMKALKRFPQFIDVYG